MGGRAGETMGRPRVSYSQYLASAHWARVRARALRVFHHTCVVCGSTFTSLEAHHTGEQAYQRRWHERVGDVVPLCPQCHEPKLPHFVCPACGTYRGRKVVVQEEE